MGTAHGVDTTPKSRPSRKAPIYPRFLTLSPVGTGKFSFSNPSRWSPMSRQTAATRYFQSGPILPNIRPISAEMSPRTVKVMARPKTKKSEKTRERLSGRCLLVSRDDAHQERDHGQNAGIQGGRHAAQEDSDDRQPGTVLKERGNVAEEAVHRASAHWIPCFFRSSRISSLGKSPTWRAISLPF